MLFGGIIHSRLLSSGVASGGLKLLKRRLTSGLNSSLPNMPPKRGKRKAISDETSSSSENNATKGKKRVREAKASKQDEELSTEKTSFDDISYDRKGGWKIVSWNVNGIRAWLKKNGLDYLGKEDPDVFCVQETKCSDDKIPAELKNLDGYKSYFLSGDTEGYSGVGVLTKHDPIDVKYGIGDKQHDSEGRVITLEFPKFYLINAYVPNSGRGLVRLDYRMDWDDAFRKYLCNLKKEKEVILTGDLNVAHNEIDLKNPKSNKRTAGFTQEERDGFSSLLEEGFVDSFRKLYPDREGAYTFWSYMMNARAKNVGWRLDYFVVSDSFIDDVVDNEIRDEVMGSDHCPIVLHLK